MSEFAMMAGLTLAICEIVKKRKIEGSRFDFWAHKWPMRFVVLGVSFVVSAFPSLIPLLETGPSKEMLMSWLTSSLSSWAMAMVGHDAIKAYRGKGHPEQASGLGINLKLRDGRGALTVEDVGMMIASSLDARKELAKPAEETDEWFMNSNGIMSTE